MLDRTRSTASKENLGRLRALATTIASCKQEAGDNPGPELKRALAQNQVCLAETGLIIVSRTLDVTIAATVNACIKAGATVEARLQLYKQVQYSRPASREELANTLTKWWALTSRMVDAHAENLNLMVPEKDGVAFYRTQMTKEVTDDLERDAQSTIVDWYEKNKSETPMPPGMVYFRAIPNGVGQDYLENLMIETALKLCPTKLCSINWGLHRVQLEDDFTDIPIAWVSFS